MEIGLVLYCILPAFLIANIAIEIMGFLKNRKVEKLMKEIRLFIQNVKEEVPTAGIEINKEAAKSGFIYRDDEDLAKAEELNKRGRINYGT